MKENLFGLTGSIGAGKSSVSSFLKQYKIIVIDCDKIAKDLLNQGEKCYYKTIKEFGKKILDEQFNIKRKELATKIFTDCILKKKLERIVHPFIECRAFNLAKEAFKNNNNRIVFIDAPLLFECNWQSYFKEVWLIVCEEKTQLKRIMQRDFITYSQACLRINSFMSVEIKKKYANVVTIENSGSIKDLKKCVYALLKKTNIRNG